MTGHAQDPEPWSRECAGSAVYRLRPQSAANAVPFPHSHAQQEPKASTTGREADVRPASVEEARRADWACWVWTVLPGAHGQHGVAWDGSQTWQLLKRQDAAVRPRGCCRSRSQLMHRHVQLTAGMPTAWQRVMGKSATAWYRSRSSLVSDRCLGPCIGSLISPGNQGHYDHAMIDAAIPGHRRSADLLWQRFQCDHAPSDLQCLLTGRGRGASAVWYTSSSSPPREAAGAEAVSRTRASSSTPVRNSGPAHTRQAHGTGVCTPVRDPEIAHTRQAHGTGVRFRAWQAAWSSAGSAARGLSPAGLHMTTVRSLWGMVCRSPG